MRPIVILAQNQKNCHQMVYDVSRWGRFQDQDEAAYFEFLCKKRCKQVVYVTKGFILEENQLISKLIIMVERYMAGEYSRQLSEKVFQGCVKVTQQGYSAGGPPCYGMARMLLDVNKKPVCILQKGEHKSIANERVIFIPREDETTETVKYIFHLYVKKEKAFKEIADELNKRDISSPSGMHWSQGKIFRILTNESYIGSRVYNKTFNRLKRGRKRNSREAWVICKNASPKIVSEEIFLEAQKRITLEKSFFITEKNIIKREDIFFLEHLKKFLLDEKRGFDNSLIKNFPVIYCMFRSENFQNIFVCFILPEIMRKYEQVLGVAVENKDDGLNRHYFLLPIQLFGFGGYVFLSENDKEFKSCRIKNNRVGPVVLRILDTMRQ